MSDDIVNFRGQLGAFKDDSGGAVVYTHPIIGIVKNNIDPLRSGKIEVYLKRKNSSNENNPVNWTTVNYMSPFFGYTPNVGSSDSEGEFIGTPQSYGFWATPPDIGTEVVCIFINGDPNFGYYIGALPKPGLTHMVPGIGASDNVIPNEGEANSYGGAKRVPISEYNNANKKLDNSSTLTGNPRPIHSYQTAILNKQGLLRDPDRGCIGSSSMRESPSRVFGMSTPGRPIYEGGYNDETIRAAIKNDASDVSFKVIGRTGGHTLVMDDGDWEGRDQLIRLRTSQGHTILMNDYAQTLFIVHANGQSYIELGKEGTIDMYSTNSVNVRTQGDLNLHADNNVNIHAENNFNLSAKNINIESIESTSQFTGTEFKHQTKNNHTVKVNGGVSIQSDGDAGIKSGGTAYINGGPNIHLNTGTCPIVPQDVKRIPITAHTDTLYDSNKGFASAPGKLTSITSRAPAHSPWAHANQGVNVKTNLSADANLPSRPSSAVSQTNAATAGVSPPITKPSVVATVPNSPAVNNVTAQSSIASSSALVSQMAVNAANGPAASAVENATGIIESNGEKFAAVGSLALSPDQLEQAGVIKPGSAVLVNKLIQDGKSLQEAIPTNLFTGKDGVTSVETFVKNSAAQTNVGGELLQQSATALKAVGAITGNESVGQIGGLLVGAATAGPEKAVDFMKNAAPGFAGNVDNLINTNNPLAGDIKSLVASGNYAGTLADKSMSGLGGVNVLDSIKGMAAGAFSKVTGAFKALKAKVPQRLGSEASTDSDSGESSQATELTLDDAKKAIASANSAINKLSAAGVPDLPNIPGSLSAVSNVVDLASNAKNILAGAESLSTDIKQIAGTITSGQSSVNSTVNGLKDKINNTGSLTAFASTGLDPKQAAEMFGALESLGSNGPVSIKVPTVSVDSFDIGPLAAQSAALLGNPKIPPLNLGALKIPSQPLTEEQIKKFDETKAKLDQLEDDKFDHRKKWLDLRAQLGSDNPETIAASNTYKQSLQEIEKLRNELSKIAT
jgi:hypothetical protein